MHFSYFLKHPYGILPAILIKYGGWIPDRLYLQILFFLKMGRKLNLKTPQTFSEKLQWLKLYNRKAEYTMMVDKYSVKNIVASLIGEKYVIPTLGVWDSPEQIEWDVLPDKFVLKTTHGGGNSGVVICKDKNTFDRNKALQKLQKSMKQDIYKSYREWPYKNVSRKIIAEQYVIDEMTKELRDYKFFAFDGKVKALFIATDRNTGNVKFDFYDSDFNHLDVYQIHPMSGKEIVKPSHFEEMKCVAEKLSKGLPAVRIDLYEANGKVFFGEFTFFHHGGLVAFHPEKWDYKFGEWIDLNNIK